MHIRIILGAKLDCVGTSFQIEDEARSLRDTAFTADDLIIRSEIDSTIQNVEQMHEVLEEIQDWATNICDNGSNLTQSDLIGVMECFRKSLEGLM